MGKLRPFGIVAVGLMLIAIAFAFMDMMDDAQVCATLAVAAAILAHLE